MFVKFMWKPRYRGKCNISGGGHGIEQQKRKGWMKVAEKIAAVGEVDREDLKAHAESGEI